MANFVQQGDNFNISIPKWKDVDKCTYYAIRIDIGDVKWTVWQRYSEFAKLHKILVADHGVTLDILPPKKVLGNRDDTFIEQRRNALQVYLSTVVCFLQKTMPKALAHFLDFHKFEILFIVKNLARHFYDYSESILSRNRHFTFTPLQLLAIHERLKQPCSNLDLTDQREDFSHVVDLCCQLTQITIVGSNDVFGDSNIVFNELQLNFSVFKNLQSLTLKCINCSKINDLGSLRFTLRRLIVDNCTLSSLCNLFLCDQVHKSNIDSSNEWKSLNDVLVCKSSVSKIDSSVKLLPNLSVLVLEDNCIAELDNIDLLINLKHLNARNNRLYLSKDFEFVSQNLVNLNLSQNSIDTLKPFASLLSLETLDLQSNKIIDVTEVAYIADLPCIENIVLSGNPVSIIVDYRVTVLEYFGTRAFRICLDNESTHQKELDKVAIKRALRVSKEKLPFSASSP